MIKKNGAYELLRNPRANRRKLTLAMAIRVSKTIAMIRSAFLAVEQRCHNDQKAIGSLFFAGSEEIKDLSLREALAEIAGTRMGQGEVIRRICRTYSCGRSSRDSQNPRFRITY